MRVGRVVARRTLSTASTPILSMKPDELAHRMVGLGIQRGWVVAIDGKLKASHPMFEEVAEYLSNEKRDYDNHEAIFFNVGSKTKALHLAVLHNTTRGPGHGGVRYWPYADVKSFLHDGLRLAQGMGRKNSLAGLWWGGGKGNIARQENDLHTERFYRDAIFADYGEFISSLRGAYYTAEDVGVKTDDVAQIYYKTRFSSCIPADIGGSGNPSVMTSWGVVSAMEGALDHLGRGTLQGKTVAVQGLGNVATPMIAKMLEKGVAKVIATDINNAAVENAKKVFAGKPVFVARVAPGDNCVLFEKADIVAPCALGGVWNEETIPRLQTTLVCGAANNQLLDATKHAQMLADRGITYVPDFLANRMGIVNCANEMYGNLPNDPAIHRHFGRDWDNSIFVMTRRVLALAEKEKTTTSVAANKIADELMKVPHPIWPDRTRQIVKSIVDSDWHKKLF